MAHTEKPSTAVLIQLRTDLNNGVYPPGEPLSISALSARIGFSPTPVREALAHLAGEGLVAERRGQGYFAAPLDAERLVELYRLHQLYVSTALVAPKAPRLDPRGGERACDPTETFFAELVVAAGDATLADAHLRVVRQLAPARRAERRLWGNAEAELSALRRLWTSRTWGALEAACTAYHERRYEAAKDLTALVRAGLEPSNATGKI